jgi:hypothetical protein
MIYRANCDVSDKLHRLLEGVISRLLCGKIPASSVPNLSTRDLVVSREVFYCSRQCLYMICCEAMHNDWMP